MDKQRRTKTWERHTGAVVGVLTACVVSAQMGTSAVNVALPSLAAWSAGGFDAAQWAVVGYLLAMTAASLVVGYVGDTIGRIETLWLGLAAFICAGGTAALAPNLAVLIAARAIQGIGAAAMTALPLAIARDTVAAKKSGAVMGLLGTAAAVGTASGPAMGGLLLSVWGWPAVFWAMLPLPLIACAVLPVLRPGVLVGSTPARDEKAPRGGAFDVAGSAAVACTVAVYAFTFTGTGLEWPRTPLLLAVVAALVGVVVVIERRAAHPVLPLRLLRTRTVGIGAILNMIVGAVMMSTLVVGPFYLSGALGMGAVSVGVAMAAGPVTSIGVGILAGRLVDRASPGPLVTAGLLVMAVAAAALAVLPPLLGLPGYLIGTVLLAPGYQLFMAANNTQIMAAVPPGRRGTASGVLGLSRNLGLVTGTSAMAGFFVAAVGDDDVAAASPTELGVGLRVVFAVSATLVAGAALLAAYADPRRETPFERGE